MMVDANNNRKITVEVMKAYEIIAPFIPSLTFNELSTGITDTEKFVAYYKGTYLDLGIKVGDPIKPGSPVHEAINKGKRVIKHIPREVIGIPYIITANPVYDSRGTIVGAVATGTATERETLIKETAGELSTAIEQISAATNDLVRESEQLSTVNHVLSELSAQAEQEVLNTNEILEYIKDIASETKVLGINASIEAARGGGAGLGFRVVASEIQNLAGSSMKSVKKIEETLTNIQKTIHTFAAKVGEFNQFSNTLMAMTQETFATLDELKKMSANLMTSVKDII